MTKLTKFTRNLGHFQTTHPVRFLVGAAIITVVAGYIASGLELNSSYEALLPDGAKQVENADMVREKTGGTRQLVIAISGNDKDTRIKFGRELAKRIRNVKNIRAVDFELDADFFRDRGLWLMDPSTLDDLVPAVENAVKIAKWQANPMHLHLDEAEEKKELDDAWKKVDEIVDIKDAELPINNVLESKDGKYVFILLIPTIIFIDIEAGKTLVAAIQKEVRAMEPERLGIEVKQAGNMFIMQEQHKSTGKDLKNASLLALIVIIAVVALFTRRPLIPFLIGIPLVVGIVWTFALTQILIGHVNIVTGFLVAVLIGLGIDFGVHIAVRFIQELKTSPNDHIAAVIRAISGTLPPALTSAMTTAGTFLAFSIADFKGFSEFGIIAGAGTILTLIASFTILPPLLVLVYSRKKISAPTNFESSLGIFKFGRIHRIAVITIVIVVAIIGAFQIDNIPFRNNFKMLRGESEATSFSDYVDANIGIGFNPTIFIAQNLDDAKRIADMARKQQETGRKGGQASRVGKVFSITDLLPKHPKESLGRIEELRNIFDDPKLDRAEKKEGERAEQLSLARKMVKTVPWGIEELPEPVRRRLTTANGENFIVYVWPDERNDADYMAAQWEDELLELSGDLKASGVTHDMADETLVMAWIYRLIVKDGPRLLILATIVVLLFLMIDFRNVKHVLLVAFPLSMGMLMFAAGMRALGMELNMFNLIVVPSVIGIGIDNAVHVFHRYREQGPGSIPFVVRTTGMAALLASLTTSIGFGSALISNQPGLRSMGSLAILGIACTFIAATIFFPCILIVLENRKKNLTT